MKKFWARNQSRFIVMSTRIRKWRWFILALIGLGFLAVEIQEYLIFREVGEGFHYLEVLLYAALLGISGILIELFARSNDAYKQAVQVLEHKHNLSLEFTSQDDWDSLSAKLAELPSKIVEVSNSYFLINNPVSGETEIAGQWRFPASSSSKTWDPLDICKTCSECINARKVGINLHKFNNNKKLGIYCLVIISPYLPTGIIRFELSEHAQLLDVQEKVFSSIGDEIRIAIQTSQDRRRIAEMQSAEVAMAERRLISTYVHDQLGQNLGYLHLKLDQLSANHSIKQNRDVESDVRRLREVANESYEIVRDILKKMQPETVPHLTNLMHEHAKSISKRAGFTLEFKSIGNPISLVPNVQQTIFFTFREMLSNVEKHANATLAEVLIIWNDGMLDISVADNGRGFTMNGNSDDHFGLGIMKERVSNLNGKLSIRSQPESGTVVSMSIPIEQFKVVSHE